MTKEEVIITATQWWSDKLASRAPHSNGDNSRASVFACMFADIGAKSVNTDQMVIFEDALSENVREMYERYFEREDMPSIIIGCDYGPCRELYAAAEKAGINTMNFPFKTWMRICPDHVEVSNGYGQPYVRI